MENEKKYYSVSDLAALLEVPRTTVNDWLKKYDRYIDFEVRGRRKVYTDASLEVLRKISAARDQGASAADLEKELSSTCAVRPEISEMESLDAPENPETGKTAAEQLPAVKLDMPSFFAEFEKREHFQARVRRRGFLWVSTLLVLLLVAACVTLFLLGQLLTLRESGKKLEERLAASQEETALLRKRAEAEFKAISGQVESARRFNTAERAELNRRLAEQKKQFESLLVRLEKNEKKRSSELRELKEENFKLKRQLRDTELEAMKKLHKLENTNLQQIAGLKQEIVVLQKEIVVLQKEKSDLKRVIVSREQEIYSLKKQSKTPVVPEKIVEKKNEQ